MLGIADPLGYVAIAFLLVLTPGPATVYILSRGYQLGLPAGFVALAGCTMGDICLILAAGLCVSAILHSYPLAFDIVRWLGAAYLVWLGGKALWPWRPVSPVDEPRAEGQATAIKRRPRSFHRIFIGGIGVIFINPKAILFFMAFFPQFIDPVNNRGVLTFVALGAIFISMNICYLSSLMLIGGKLRRPSDNSRGFTFWINKLTGLAFIGFGIKLATSTLR
jgi:leucine efflux protein